MEKTAALPYLHLIKTQQMIQDSQYSKYKDALKGDLNIRGKHSKMTPMLITFKKSFTRKLIDSHAT